MRPFWPRALLQIARERFVISIFLRSSIPEISSTLFKRSAMAQSPRFTPSPSPGVASDNMSDSSSDDAAMSTTAGGATGAPSGSASRAASPTGAQPEVHAPTEAMECQWEDCGKNFTNLAVLIEHIHNGALTLLC